MIYMYYSSVANATNRQLTAVISYQDFSGIISDGGLFDVGSKSFSIKFTTAAFCEDASGFSTKSNFTIGDDRKSSHDVKLSPPYTTS